MGKLGRYLILISLFSIWFAALLTANKVEAAPICPVAYDQCVVPFQDAFVDEQASYEDGFRGDLYVGYDEESGANQRIAFLKYAIPEDLPPMNEIDKVELGIYVEFIRGNPELHITGMMEETFWPAETDRSDQDLLNGLSTEYIGAAGLGLRRGEWLVTDVTHFVKSEMNAADFVTFVLEGQAADGVHYVLFEDMIDEDGNLAATAKYGSRLMFTFKDLNPPTGSILINGGDASVSEREVMLDVDATDEEGSYPLQMRFRNENSDWGRWQEMSPSVNWTLSEGEGRKSVYMELRDAAGNVSSQLIKAEILLDTAPPVITGVRDGEVVKSSVTLRFNEGEGRLNGKPFASGTTVSEEGNYTLSVTDEAGNTVTVSFGIDKSNPVATKFVIENDAPAVSEQTVTLSVYADKPLPGMEMRFRNESHPWSSWEPASDKKTGWKLSDGKGIKTVSMQLRDAQGKESNILKDTIRFGDKNLSARLTINNSRFYTNNTRATLSIQVDGSLSNYEMRFSRDNVTWSDRDWETARATKQWTLRTTNGVQMVYMQLRDEAGNILTDSDLIILDTHKPTGTLKIEDGKSSVTTHDVMLNLTYSDETPLEVRFSNDNTSRWSTWESVKEKVNWTLSPGSGQKTVRMQLRDAAGNVSSTISDTITIGGASQAESYDYDTADTWEPTYDMELDEGPQNDFEQEACGPSWEDPLPETMNLVEAEADRLGILLENVKDVMLLADEGEGSTGYQVVSFDAGQSGVSYAAILQPDGTFLPVPAQIYGDCIEVKLMESATVILFQNHSYFTDMIDHWAESSIVAMADRLILSGPGNDQYEPDRSVTRAEFATALIRTLGLQAMSLEQHFTDVPEYSWAYPYIETAFTYDLISGYNDQTFRPNQTINRQEAAVILFNAMQFAGLDTELILEADEWLHLYQDKEDVSEWAREAIALNIQYGIIRGDNKERLLPQNELTRAQMAVMLSGYMDLN